MDGLSTRAMVFLGFLAALAAVLVLGSARLGAGEAGVNAGFTLIGVIGGVVVPGFKRAGAVALVVCGAILLTSSGCSWFKTQTKLAADGLIDCAQDELQAGIDEAITVLSPVLACETADQALTYASSHDLGNSATWTNVVDDYATRHGFNIAMCALRRLVIYGISSVGAEAGPESKTAQVRAQTYLDAHNVQFVPQSAL